MYLLNKNFVPDLASAEGIWKLSVKDKTGCFRTIVQKGRGVGGNDSCRWEVEGITVTASVTASESGFEWGISIENNSGMFVNAVHYPVFGGIEADEKSYFVLPWQTGVKINDPVNELLQDEFIPSEWTGAERKAHQFAAEYPGMNTMQFMVFGNTEQVFYYGIHDSQANYKTFGLYRDSTKEGAELASGHFPPQPVGPGETFSLSYPVCTAVAEGGWLAASRIYRRWAVMQQWCRCGKRSERKDIPGWVEQTGVWYWNWVYAQEKGDTDTILPVLCKINKKVGAPCAFHWYGWNGQYHDTDYPEYAISPEAEKRLQEALELYHRNNIRVFPYLNGRNWNIDTESWFTEKAADYACLRDYPREGEKYQYYVEPYMNRPFVPMCPHTEFWQDRVCRNVERVLDFGMDGAYIDQISSSFPVSCHNPDHGHTLYGNYFMKGYCRMLDKVRDMRNRVNPEAVLTSESVIETYISSFDMFLGYIAAMPMTVLGRKTETIPLFSAVYHDCIPLYGTGTVADAPDFYYGQALDIQNGILPSLHGIFSADMKNPEIKPKLDWICKWAKIYRHIAADMRDAVLLDLPELSNVRTAVPRYGVAVEVPAVCAVIWECANGRKILAAVNHSGREIKITLPGGNWNFEVTEEGIIPAVPQTEIILAPRSVIVLKN